MSDDSSHIASLEGTRSKCEGNVLDGLFVFAGVLNPEGELLHANQTVLDATGKSLDELAGRPFDKISWWPDNFEKKQLVRNAVARAVAGETSRFDTEIIKGDGTLIPVDIQLKPMLGDKGNVTRLVFSAIDITERKMTEKILIETDRHKDVFLATLAHELRNPLTPLINAIQFLDSPGIGEKEHRRYIDIMKRQTDIMVRLVNDLLDISRVRQGKVSFVSEPVSISDVVEQSVETSASGVEKYHHHLKVKVSDPDMMVEGDFTRLAQVVSNLIDNAAKYTPDGGHIKVAAKRDGDHAEIKISDDGIGISQELQGSVFDMFKQAGLNMGVTVGGALGVGLALAKNYIEKHNGTIKAFSKGEGKGSSFIIRLPLTERPAPLRSKRHKTMEDLPASG